MAEIEPLPFTTLMKPPGGRPPCNVYLTTVEDARRYADEWHRESMKKKVGPLVGSVAAGVAKIGDRLGDAAKTTGTVFKETLHDKAIKVAASPIDESMLLFAETPRSAAMRAVIALDNKAEEIKGRNQTICAKNSDCLLFVALDSGKPVGSLLGRQNQDGTHTFAYGNDNLTGVPKPYELQNSLAIPKEGYDKVIEEWVNNNATTPKPAAEELKTPTLPSPKNTQKSR